MVHIQNVPHILKNGITHKKSKYSNPDFASIGDISLITTRASKIIEIDNGVIGNANYEEIVLGDYIPFYFGVRMPMLYVIQRGGNFVEKPVAGSDIIYITCKVESVLKFCPNVYFSDGHATDNFTSFYDQSNIHRLQEIIN